MKYSELKDYIEQLRPFLIGKRISRLLSFSKNSFFYHLSGEFDQLSFILDENPRIYISNSEMKYKNVETNFFNQFKKEIGSGEIKDVSLLENERIVKLDVETINQTFQEEKKSIILELIPNKSNVIITNENGVILTALNMTTLDVKRAIYKGIEYVPPKNKISFTTTKEEKPLENYLAEFISLEKEFGQRKKMNDFSAYHKRMKSKKTSLQKKITLLEKELDSAEINQNYQEFGNFILTNIDSIQEGQKEIEYYDGTLIELDENLSPAKNAERYFLKSKKAKSKIIHAKEEIANAENDLEAINSLLDAFEKATYEEAEKMAGGVKTKNKQIEPLASQPYFINFGGTKILFGLNSTQNDYLTFSLDTSRNHLFLHINGISGSHVIIKKDNPSEKEIEIASELVLLLSKKKDCEVMIAFHRDIRKGKNPGQVIFKNHKIKRVNHISDETRQLFEKKQRYSD
ncbi:MAG: NFACT family protein [Bacilli bacterium]|nr:NFACT family protein [Bacilli bacterium]